MSARRRYVWSDELQQVVEVAPDWAAAERRAQTPTEAIVYGNLTATDGTPLDSRKKHRNYMKANGLTMSSDYSDEFRAKQKSSKAREDKGALRETVARATYKHQRGTKL